MILCCNNHLNNINQIIILTVDNEGGGLRVSGSRVAGLAGVVARVLRLQFWEREGAAKKQESDEP